MIKKYRALGMALALSSASLLGLALDTTPALAASPLNPYAAIKLNGASHPTVYLQRNGTLHAIGSAQEFYDLGYSFSDVHRANLLPDPIGKPIELFRQTANPKVYLLQNGTLHWISTPAQLYALGYTFHDVYKVSVLPDPIGAPETVPSTTPTSLDFLSGFPYLPATSGVTKTIALYALTSTGTIQSLYSGQATVQWSSNAAGLQLGNSVSAVNSPITVTFHQGVAHVNVTTGTGAIGTQAQLLAEIAGSTSETHLTLTLVSANSSVQAGYRVYTPSGTPVSGLTPLWDNTPTEALQIKPVNGFGNPVAAQVGDPVVTGLVTGEPGDQAYMEHVNMSSGATSTAITFNDEETDESGPMTPTKSPGVIRVYVSVPREALVTRVVNQETGAQMSLTSPIYNYLDNSSSVEFTQNLSGIVANQSYLVTVAFDSAQGSQIVGSPLTQFVPPMWNTPLSSAADFYYGVNTVPGLSSGAYVGPLSTANQGKDTFVFHSGNGSSPGGAIALTLNTPPSREWIGGAIPSTLTTTQVLMNSY